MTCATNALGQPIGPTLPDWTPPPVPPRSVLEGRFCRVEPLNIDRHAADLYNGHRLDTNGHSWTYLAYGPFPSLDAYQQWIRTTCLGADPLFFAIVDRTHNNAVGVASYLNIAPDSGCIEVGHLHFSERLKKTPVATEAMFLMMQQAFTLGYRRYCWKCDHLNAASRAAALRLGLSFEGIFRQAIVYKGRNRDTAWYAAIDREWPALRQAFTAWLAPDNFNAQGTQKTRLTDLTRPILKNPLR